MNVGGCGTCVKMSAFNHVTKCNYFLQPPDNYDAVFKILNV